MSSSLYFIRGDGCRGAFFNNNVTTGIGVAQARGVILTAAERGRSSCL